jgi:hypothetical protein
MKITKSTRGRGIERERERERAKGAGITQKLDLTKN